MPETTTPLLPLALLSAALVYFGLAVATALFLFVVLSPHWRARLRKRLMRAFGIPEPAALAQEMAFLRQQAGQAPKLQLKLEESRTRYEQLDSVKTDFITIASHELRTPLAQLRGYIDILDALNEGSMLDSEKTASMVGNLRKASERMEELISDMLDVSQIGVNAMDLRFASTGLESAMRIAIEPLTDVIKGRKLTLSARGLRNLPTIEADMQRLVQAFRSVVGNAVKFTPDGGRIEITGSVAPNPDGDETTHVLIAVTDTGVGIDIKNLDLVFEKFFRAYDPTFHSTGAYKFMGAGPGLGLTIARGVIEGHGGEIWAESSGNDMKALPGSTFYILLPLRPPQSARRVMTMKASEEPTRMKLRTKL